MIDIDAVRADTPGVADIVHFNNAGSSLPPEPVVTASIDYLRLEARMGGYEAEDASAAAFTHFYDAAASMLGCRPDEVAFVSSASDGWWRAFMSLPLEAGDRIVVGRSEFASNALALLQARNRGIELVVVDNDANGVIDLDALASALSVPTKLVCLTQISMSNGAIQPAEDVGELAARSGAFYLLDACQAAGQMPLDVGELRCDFLVFTGRKFVRGPRGSGVLYARSGVMERLSDPVFVDLRSADWTSADTYSIQPDARRFEFGENAFAAKVGLGVAIEYAMTIGLEPIGARVTTLAETFRDGLGAIPGVTVHDQGVRRSGIVTFTVDGMPAGEVGRRLRERSINTSTPGARNARFDLGARGIDAVVRAGVHYFNTDEEIVQVLDVVGEIASTTD